MAAPPVLAGAVNATVACASAATAVTAVGAPGTTALTAKLRVTRAAGRTAALPAWSASMVQVPTSRNVSTPPDDTAHTAGVADASVTGRPESRGAVRVGEVPKSWGPGSAKVIVWLAAGVTAFDAADVAPVPAEVVAVTVKVYATPLVSPVMVMGEPAPVAVSPPGSEVTV